MKKPNFFIVGAPKCGTTALAHYLSEHPNIFICNPKEPHFFLHPMDINRTILKKNHYLSLFKNVGNEYVVGEASVWYLYSNYARQQIKNFNSDAKIIIMRRNVVDFVASLHAQLVFSGHEHHQNIEDSWYSRKNIVFSESEYETIEEFPQWRLAYMELINKDKYIQRYISDFGDDNVLVLSLEEFASDPINYYRKTLDFLGVPDDGRQSFPKVNPNRVHRYKWVRIALYLSWRCRWISQFIKSFKDLVGVKSFKIGKIWSHFVKRNTLYQPRKPVSESLKNEIEQTLVKIKSNSCK